VLEECAEFEEFFREQHPRLVAIALALTGDVDVARDAAQETLTRAYRDWAKVGGLDLPSAWARKVLINAVIDAGRRQRRDERLVRRLEALPAPPVTTPAEESATWAAVRLLPPRQRAAVVLHYVDDVSVAGVAEILGVTEGTVKTTLHDARASLRGRLGEESR
jgi:RNA polymerase sigma-70 factor, ECF subfamily